MVVVHDYKVILVILSETVWQSVKDHIDVEGPEWMRVPIMAYQRKRGHINEAFFELKELKYLF
jgi:hypothetical protein